MGRPKNTDACKHPGCDRGVKSRGYCQAHYMRSLKGMDMDKPIRLRRKMDEDRWHVQRDGYVFRYMNGKPQWQHRVVMAEMIGRELLSHESPHHKNGDRTDNRPENLELWSTFQPRGQRVVDKLAWAHEIIALYGNL